MTDQKLYIEEWFPTQIMCTNAVNLLPLAQKMFAVTDMSSYKTDKYDNGYTSFFDSNRMPDIPEVEEFKKELILISAVLAGHQGVDLQNNTLKVSDIWMNCMERNGTHGAHVHGESHYSGTFYINAPEGVGKILFHSPIRQYWDFCDPPRLKSADGNRESCAYTQHVPAPGKLLLWNSWLRHEVTPHQSDEARLSISFNIYAHPN
jgi:uncharacterized protein (TIGR02466 family)